MAKKSRNNKNQQISRVNGQVQKQLQEAINNSRNYITIGYWNRSCRDLENFVRRTFKQLKNLAVSGHGKGGFAISWDNTTQGA